MFSGGTEDVDSSAEKPGIDEKLQWSGTKDANLQTRVRRQSLGEFVKPLTETDMQLFL